MTALEASRETLQVSPAVQAWTAVLGGGAVAQGVWAFIWPDGFFEHFPVEGAAWVSTLGPYNAHLTSDVGAALLGMGVAALAAARRRSVAGVKAVMAGFVVFGTAHLAFHLGELHHFDRGSAIAQVVSLLALVVVPGTLFATAERRES